MNSTQTSQQLFEKLDFTTQASDEATFAAIETGHFSKESASPARNVGLVSAIFLISNRLLGTGIFANPATILAQSGSVGSSLIVWAAGTLMAGCGLFVFMEWNSALPENRGEKDLLDYYFRTPESLMSSMCVSYFFLLGFAAANSVAFAEYALVTAGIEPDTWNQRIIALVCITIAMLINSVSTKYSTMLQNITGVFKMFVITAIIVCGCIAFAGGFTIENTHAFDQPFTTVTSPSSNGMSIALLNVIWCFTGYSNANQTLSETKNPVRALKISAPIAFVAVGILYMLSNIAYFAVVPANTIEASGTVLVSQFFGIIFGSQVGRVASAFVALSALGNVMSTVSSQGHLIQIYAKENLVPFSGFFASLKPWNTPLTGMFQHWLVSVLLVFAPPPSDAYKFIVNLISYPLCCINLALAFALFMINLKPGKYTDWTSPIRATIPVTMLFLLSNLFLIVASFLPPSTPNNSVYENLPYWLHCVGLGAFLVGTIHWYAKKKWTEHYMIMFDDAESECISFGDDGLELFDVPI